MDYPKIKNSASFTGVAVISLLLIGVFFGTYQYFDFNKTEAGLEFSETRYKSTYDNLSAARDDIKDDVDNIKDNAAGVVEAEGTWFAVWNGLKGLGNTVKLFISFITSSLKVTTAFMGFGAEMIPEWAFDLISIAITAFLVFLLIKVLIGAAQNL